MGLFNEDRPRQHHYLFAHRELPAMARRFAANLAELARSERLDTALAMTWDRVGRHLPADARWPHDGLAASLHDVDGASVVLVTMPRPEHGAEAYFAALVVSGGQLSDYFVLEHGWTTRDEPRTVLCKWDGRTHVNLGDGPLSDYFVLEHGWTTRDEPRTVLCKWDGRTHVNLGDGPPAEAPAFLSAVQARLWRSPA